MADVEPLAIAGHKLPWKVIERDVTGGEHGYALVDARGNTIKTSDQSDAPFWRGVADGVNRLASERQQPAVGLTRLQAKVLGTIEDHIATHGVAPSYDYIRYAAGIASTSGVNRVVEQLRDRGRISFQRQKARSIVVLAPLT